MSEILPDVLKNNMKVIFCGTAAGKESAKKRIYYARENNKFWRTLHKIGLTPDQVIKSEEYLKVVQYNIGLTDMVKNQSGLDKDIDESSDDIKAFKDRIVKCSPRVLAFNGKKAASAFFGTPKNKIIFGKQGNQLGDTVVFILPSTSGTNTWWIKHNHIERWEELASYIDRLD